MAMVAALPPEIISKLIVLAQAVQAAGSLPTPADWNQTTAEASGKAKLKAAGAACAAEQAGAAAQQAFLQSFLQTRSSGRKKVFLV